MTSAQRLTARLLHALDGDYNVVDMRTIDEVISLLENINITKELLETTRLGKHVNELRRRTDDVALARRTKILLKRWRDLVIPDKAGSKPAHQSASAESTPRQSPSASRGISPAVTPSVTPRLCSPQVFTQGHRQGSLTPTSDNMKLLQQTYKRQPLTSPALHNLSPGLRSVPQPSKNSSPNFKNVGPLGKCISPAIKNFSQNSNSSTALKETVWNVTPSKDAYDSDSNDVILVDDNLPDDNVRTTFGSNSNSATGFDQNEKYNKRPRSPVNGGPDAPLIVDEPRKGEKRERRESRGRKTKKRRNHTKSENITVDHSAEVVSVESPFLPISSASTSPALSATGSVRNGVTSGLPTVSLVDDPDSRSPAPLTDSKSKSSSSSSRKNGCKKLTSEVDEYSNFIRNKIPTGGRKVKTTKELLEEMQARKSGKILPVPTVETKSKIKKDFLATYDSKKQLKKEPLVVTDIIELNDSNSGSKIIESVPESSADKDDKSNAKPLLNVKGENDEPTKFEPLEIILARLPPIDKQYVDNDDFFTPACTCKMLYDLPDDAMKDDLPSKTSLFEIDSENKFSEEQAQVNALTPISNFKEIIDPQCHAATVYVHNPSQVGPQHVQALHNSYIADVNGSKCKSTKHTNLACRTNAWGLRPYYDCSRDLFLNVVPKYNFLDYSLDRCVKNLKNVALDKYEPAETVSDSSDWFLNLENEHFEKWRVKNESLACDDFESAADSPFSEKVEEDEDTIETPGTELNSDIKCSDSDKNNANVDRDPDVSSSRSPAVKEEKDTAAVGKEADTEPEKAKKSNCFEILDYEVETQCRPFATTYSKCVFLDDDVDFTDDAGNERVNSVRDEAGVESEPMDVEPATAEPRRAEVPAPRPARVFTYEDSITLLPLSILALNALATYDPRRAAADLACVFRNKNDCDDGGDEDPPFRESCELTYGMVNSTRIIEMKDVTNSALRRTRDLYLEDHDEDANSGDPVAGRSPGPDNQLSNSGAFVNDSEVVEKCIKNGCPSWIPGSVPPNAFKEWHEPVVRTSYNEDPLTILPYVVID